MRGFFMGFSRVPSRRAGRQLGAAALRRAFLVNAAARARGRLARSRVTCCHPIPLRGPTVTATQQPKKTSPVDMVNFIQGYVEVYSILHSS
jgi:hypothetical protein